MKSSSIISLIIVNFVPFFGVIFFDWSLFSVMLFYWSENIVIGFYNILKMIKVGKLYNPEQNAIFNIAGWLFILFFILHYGGFTFGHGIFVFAVFGPPDISALNILIGITSLFISHGISYFENFIKKEEYKRISPGTLFTQPYKRVMVMHVTIIFGGYALKSLNLPFLSVLLLVVLKTVIDLKSHQFEHKKFSETITKDTTIREAFGKTPWFSMIPKIFFNELKKNPDITNDEISQKITSEVKKEFQQRINSELGKEKNNNEFPPENDDTRVNIKKGEDNIKNQ